MIRRLLSCPFGLGYRPTEHTCTCILGGYDLKHLSWACVNTCECELEEQQRLAEDGFEEWRSDPVSVSAHFMNSACVPCDFRGKPLYLKCKKALCSKTYVLLGVSRVGDVALELDCTPLNDGKDFYTVCRIAYICT